MQLVIQHFDKCKATLLIARDPFDSQSFVTSRFVGKDVFRQGLSIQRSRGERGAGLGEYEPGAHLIHAGSTRSLPARGICAMGRTNVSPKAPV
jgi:hypothetical protein